ncbi:MAG: FeoB-associated Cys-rich membrane protein [Desulfobacterales bacterium]|nr:MAG: FeoB-associated Cys-rich membrane protein [Desulfobacterales bacterium]
MTIDSLAVILIVGAAAVYIAVTFRKKTQKGNTCDCGCSTCSSRTSSCELPDEKTHKI